MASSRRLSVLLTGATGYVGGYIARHLVERGHEVRALTRNPGVADGLREWGVTRVRGDVSKGEPLDDAVDGCEVVIHLVGIIREKPPAVTFEGVHTRGTLRMVEAAARAGVRKFVHMSALGAHPDGPPYQRTKFEAEEVVRRSGVPHVIFRPSIIVGPGGDFVDLLLRIIRFSPVTPVIGDGRYRIQPVDVEDVAAAFVQAAERDDLKDECFEIGGPHKLTYNRMLQIVSEELGRRRPTFHVPVALVRPLIDLASNWRLPTPINSDELEMLLGESVVAGDGNVLREVFSLEPNSFRSVLQRFPRRRGILGQISREP